MAGDIIRPSALPDRPTPVASEKVPVDNGVSVGGSTIQAMVEAGRPAASQAEAEAGTNPYKAMVPLTTKQSISYEVGRTVASKAQGDKADAAVQPDDLAAVATSGAYSDLSGKPVIPPGLSDGDKGDVTVSSEGETWLLNPGAVEPSSLAPSVLIQTNTTINVPSEQPTIEAAFDRIKNTSIGEASSLTIKLADGTFGSSSPVSVNHKDGHRIRIIGNQANPAACIIEKTTDEGDLLVLSNGGRLMEIDGVTLRSPSKQNASRVGTGFLVVNGSEGKLGPNTIVRNFYYGAAARVGSALVADSVKVYDAGDVALWAFVGSSLRARYSMVFGASDVANDLGYGIQAEYGSSVDCEFADVTGCRKAGIAALTGGVVRALSALSHDNGGSGLLVRGNGHINHSGGSAINNGRWGWEELGDGTIFGTGVTRTGNTLGSRKPIIYLDQFSDADPAVKTTSGPLILDGLAGNFIRHGGHDVLRAYALTGSEVNYTQVEASNAGSPVAIRARGADNDIDLLLDPKLNGRVRFGTRTSRSDTPVTGSFQMKMADGTLVYVALVAGP